MACQNKKSDLDTARCRVYHFLISLKGQWETTDQTTKSTEGLSNGRAFGHMLFQLYLISCALLSRVRDGNVCVMAHKQMGNGRDWAQNKWLPSNKSIILPSLKEWIQNIRVGLFVFLCVCVCACVIALLLSSCILMSVQCNTRKRVVAAIFVKMFGGKIQCCCVCSFLPWRPSCLSFAFTGSHLCFLPPHLQAPTPYLRLNVREMSH